MTIRQAMEILKKEVLDNRITGDKLDAYAMACAALQVIGEEKVGNLDEEVNINE